MQIDKFPGTNYYLETLYLDYLVFVQGVVAVIVPPNTYKTPTSVVAVKTWKSA